MTRKEKKIYDLQSPATKLLMDAQAARKVKDDWPYQNEIKISKVSDKAQCLKKDGSVDLNIREISQKDHDEYQRLRYQRGKWFEEIRTAYLKRMAAEGKIHISLMDQIETNHVMPPEPVKERAESAYLGTLGTIKEKFKKFMSELFQPSHAEIMAEAMRRTKDDK